MSVLYSWTTLTKFFKALFLYNVSVFQVQTRRQLFWLGRLLIPSSLHLLGFRDKSCFTGWGSEPPAKPDWWIRPSYLCPLETGCTRYTPGQWVSIKTPLTIRMDYVRAILLVQRHHMEITFYCIYLLFYSTLISFRLGCNFANTTGQDSVSVISSCSGLPPRSINTKIL